MNLAIKSAIAVALLSAASMASFGATIQETIPGNGDVPNPGLGDGNLMAEVLDTTTNHYDTINLGSALGAFKTLSTAAGTTYDFGVISNFSSLFSAADVSSGAVQFLVAASNLVNPGHAETLVTLATAQTTVSNTTAQNVATALSTAIGPFNQPNACNGTNPCGATSTLDPNFNQILSPLTVIGLNTTTGTVGSSTGLEMFDVLQAKSGLGSGTIADMNGSWSISATGDVTYTVAGGTVVTPLPAAVWLLGSGLLGLAGVGRRKKAA
jgi:hypothetical protein